MPVLDVKALTMRFGGLTAVNKVDFSVEKDLIFSIIGPNGAGKTTVFNAMTGVYAPTDGEILFEGRDLRRPFRRRIVAAVSLIGLLTGAALGLFAAGLDPAWRAAVTLNYPDKTEPFPVRKALGDLWDFIHAGVMAEREVNRLTDLEIREKAGKHAIRSTSNKVVLEEHESAERAEERLDLLRSLVNLAGRLETTVSGKDRWIARTDAGPVMCDTEEEARKRGEPGRADPALWYVLGGGRRILESFPTRDLAKDRLFDLAVRSGKVRWRLVTRASLQTLAFASTPEQAQSLRNSLQEMVFLGMAAPLEERDGKTAVLSADRARELARFGSRAEAEERLAELAPIGASVKTARFTVWAALLLGIALGAGGSFLVWNRARRTPDVIARCGLTRTFQNIRLFPDMLALENVLMGMDARLEVPAWRAALRTPAFRAEEASARNRALDLLRFVGLEHRARDIAKSLPYGDQRRLEIARALATNPRLVLLDEPAAGMNPAETGELMKLIRRIRDTGVTVILIEHHMSVVMGISDRILVLDYGTRIAEGTPPEVRANPRVIEAYLGKEEVG